MRLGCVGVVGDESWKLWLGELLRDCGDLGNCVVLMKRNSHPKGDKGLPYIFGRKALTSVLLRTDSC